MVARRAHNPKVVGSSPSSATKKSPCPVRDKEVFLLFLNHSSTLFLTLTPQTPVLIPKISLPIIPKEHRGTQGDGSLGTQGDGSLVLYEDFIISPEHFYLSIIK